MSGRYSLPDGIGVPYSVPVSDTESDLHIQVGDHLGDEDLKHRLKEELA